MVQTKLAIVLGLIGFAVLAGGAYALGSREDDSPPAPQDQTAAWAAGVRTAIANGAQDTIVAMVDTKPIYKSQVTGMLIASSALGGGMEVPSTPEAALDQLIDNALVAAVAQRAGTAVSDDEVTAIIENGTVRPLKAGKLTTEQREAAEAALALSGTDVDHVLEHEPTRNLVRDMLLRTRYLQASGLDRETVVAEARQAIPFVLVPGALD